MQAHVHRQEKGKVHKCTPGNCHANTHVYFIQVKVHSCIQEVIR